jgi:Outer membrane protein beta-barrel domain
MATKLLSLSLLVSLSVPALAQYTPASGTASGEPVISPKNGQSQDQLGRDRYECYGWAKQQSGFDPAQPGSGGAGPDLYRRAFTACMSGRGYQVSYPAPAAGSPPSSPPPIVQPMIMRQYWWQEPELVYRPFHVAIEGGYTATAGSTGDNLDDGGNVGLGVSWFPSESLPVGLRIDGSWSRFDARYGYFDSSGDAFTHSHENIYGGDADLQFNLPHPSSRYQFYLLGGAGWYREQQVVDHFESGCGYYYCGPSYGGQQTSTTGWRSSWNAGVGGEVALPEGTSFFVEVRYQRIAPHDSDMQFVPIRFGLRF